RVRTLLGRRKAQLDQIRRAMKIRARLEVWLYTHVPATIALLAALTTVVVGMVLYAPVQSFFRTAPPFQTNGDTTGTLIVFGLAVVTVLVGVAIGWAFAGPDRGVSMRTAGITAFVVGGLIFVDRVMQVWQPYANYLRGRPIPTFGDRTPDLGGNYWVGVLDSYTHLILPTATLILIAFAAYTRYSRSSMLEVMNQDYIRTARAKGLPERVVVVRHAFRNTLIP
ncbi:MAG TPA: ABC transporter permease, partial [Actinotalea sp.]|nr:ABC transporter permease [Actinotalea sp.]